MSRLRFDLNLFTVTGLPAWSAGPQPGAADFFARVRDAGYQGLQHDAPVAGALAAALRMTGSARVLHPDQALEVARRHADQGFDASTIHLGHGLETADEAARLVEAILDAVAATSYPLFVENHRATLTQDMRRTLDLIAAFPGLRFNADMSNWYTGLEMPYGDFAAKLDALAPFFARVRFMHGRIGNSACMQVAVADGDPAAHLRHYREMWRRCAQGFLDHAAPHETLVFAPELLPATLDVDGADLEVNYARLRPDGEEECDRWEQASRLCAIMQDIFDRCVPSPAQEHDHASRLH